MNKLYTITYHKDCFNDVERIELSSKPVDDYTYRTSMTYLPAVGLEDNKTFHKTREGALRKIADLIRKPPHDFKEEGQKALIIFANEIAVDNPEWLI